jgi:hypothetical protein
MALHHSPKINIKNLRFYIDISNKKSFVPNASVINSVFNRSISTYNNPSYTGDSLIFDGISQSAYGVHTINSINQSTINIWLKFNSTSLNTPSYIPFWLSDASGRMIFIYTAPNLNYFVFCTENKSSNKRVYFANNFQPNQWYNLSIIKNENNFLYYRNLELSYLQDSIEGYLGLWNIYNQHISFGAGLFQGQPINHCPIEIAKFYLYDTVYSITDLTNLYNVYKSKFNIS